MCVCACVCQVPSNSRTHTRVWVATYHLYCWPPRMVSVTFGISVSWLLQQELRCSPSIITIPMEDRMNIANSMAAVMASWIGTTRTIVFLCVCIVCGCRLSGISCLFYWIVAISSIWSRRNVGPSECLLISAALLSKYSSQWVGIAHCLL